MLFIDLSKLRDIFGSLSFDIYLSFHPPAPFRSSPGANMLPLQRNLRKTPVAEGLAERGVTRTLVAPTELVMAATVAVEVGMETLTSLRIRRALGVKVAWGDRTITNDVRKKTSIPKWPLDTNIRETFRRTPPSFLTVRRCVTESIAGSLSTTIT